MPSPVGHALAGLAVAWTADLLPARTPGSTAPPNASWYRRAGGGLALACAVLAALPDIDLLFPGQHRTITHSVGGIILTFIIAAAVTGKVTPRSAVRATLVITCAFATHLALDWMAVDPVWPYGIQALWPFSQRWFISGWDVFLNTERRHVFSMSTAIINARAVLREIAILAPLAAAAWLVRVKALARLAPEVTGGDHPPQ